MGSFASPRPEPVRDPAARRSETPARAEDRPPVADVETRRLLGLALHVLDRLPE